MDLDTGAVISAELQAADQGDTTTMPGTLARAAEHLAAVDAAPTPTAPAELIADRGYHSRAGLKALDGGPWKTRISEPRRDEFSRWHGDDEARRAVYNNRTRLLSGVARQAFKLRAELVERGFALILDRGGMRRVWLHGRENVQKLYRIHVAGYNLGLIMRLLTGAGTPREFRVRASAWLFVISDPDGGLIVFLFVATGDQSAAFAVKITPETRSAESAISQAKPPASGKPSTVKLEAEEWPLSTAYRRSSVSSSSSSAPSTTTERLQLPTKPLVPFPGSTSVQKRRVRENLIPVREGLISPLPTTGIENQISIRKGNKCFSNSK